MKPRNEPIFTKEPDRYLQELDREHEEFWARNRFVEDEKRALGVLTQADRDMLQRPGQIAPSTSAGVRREAEGSGSNSGTVLGTPAEQQSLEASERTISDALVTVRRLGVEAFRLEERAKHQALSVKDLYDLEAALSDACTGLRVARELLEPEKPF